MRLLIRCAAGLYPAQWRARYGAELDALVEDVDAGWLEFVDVCKGAVKMQIMSGSAWRFAAACGVAGLLVAGVVALRSHSQYQSQAVLRMTQQASLDQRIEELNKAEQDILSRRSLTTMIQQLDLYKEDRRTLPLEDIVQNMRNRSIQIRMLSRPHSTEPTSAFSVAFDYDDAPKAQAVVTALTAQFITAMKASAPLEVLDPASLPQHPFAPNRPVILVVGLFLGVVTGAVLLGIRRWPLVPLAGLLVAVLVLPATYLIPNQYRSQAVLRSKTGDPAKAAMQAVNNLEFLESLVRQFALYPDAKAGVERMHNSLTVRDINVPAGKVCLLSFAYSDRYKAMSVMREIVAEIGADPAAGQMEVLDPPSLPEQAFFPNRLSIVLAALFAGLLIGAILLAVRRHRTLAPAT